MARINLARRLVSGLTVLSFGLLNVVAPAFADSGVQIHAGANLGTVSLDDTAHVINRGRLLDAFEKIDLNVPTNVAGYTRGGNYSHDVNTKALEFSRKTYPEWNPARAEDYGDYWADGLLIITLSEKGHGDGQIGTYFGVDGKVTTSQMEGIHEAG